MKNNSYILILTFLFFVFLTCSRDKTILTVEPINNLTGTWSETFDWEGRQPGYVIIEKNSIFETIPRTSTLTFIENQFSVKILPPVQIQKIVDGSFVRVLSDDTLFTGQYQVIDDTIILYLDDREESDIYHYAIKNDTLKLDAFFTTDTADTSGQVIGRSFINFLWAYSFLKWSGNFVRIEEQIDPLQKKD